MNQKHDPTQLIARCDGISYQQLLDRESNPVPGSLREDTRPQLGSDNLDYARWTSREFHDREVAKLWNRTWQMACRESHIANTGDYTVYDIAHYSVLLTRTASGDIKGFYNSCRHRGRMLKRGTGQATELRCPYHGFTWALDGEFKGAPCLWDFAHIDPDNFALPQVQVATWGGWVFINMDRDAPSLSDYMGILPAHFERWEIDKCHVVAHVEKVINCNWKAGVEAFIESYHAIHTHPQIIPYSGIDNSQYDVWGDHISRTITPMGVINPSHQDVYSEEQCLEAILAMSSRVAKDGIERHVGPDNSARELIAERNYRAFSPLWDRDLAAIATQSEVMDSILYMVFPNFAPWAGFQPQLTYRHRPNGDDHESCIMDIFVLGRCAEGSPRPADAATVRLGADEPFMQAKDAIGEGLARVFDQDATNLPFVQRGMRASGTGEAVLGNYQEVRIRHYHQTLDKYLNAR